MSSKRFFVTKNDGDGRKNPVGGGSKTGAKARDVVQRARALQPRGSSASFTVAEGRKK
jgi:hypothetical protein